VAGAVTGALALGKIGDAHAGCMQGSDGVWHCPPSSQAANSSAASAVSTLSPVSAVCFAVGGAAVVTGVILAVVRPGGGKPAEKAGLSIDVAPTYFGLRGRF
jgi:hypothetical protein